MSIALEHTLNATAVDAARDEYADDDVYFLDDGKPATTLLYGFAPRGIGTGEVETLHGHFLSLAYEHRVSPKRLAPDTLNVLWQNSASSFSTQMSWSASHGRLMIGTTNNTQFWVRVLQAATGRLDLDRTTFLPVAHQLNGERLIFKGLRHCPKCFEEDIKAGQRPYLRLLWQVALIDCCHVHGTALIPSECGKPVSGRVRPKNSVKLGGVCPGCCSVGYRCLDTVANPASGSSLWKAQELADLIAKFDLVRQVPIWKVKAALREYHQSYVGLSALARRSLIAKSALWRWLKTPNARLSLPQYLKIAASEGFSLVGLMTGDLSKATHGIDAQLGKCRKPVKDLELVAIKARLLEAMDLPIPLQHVANEFDVTTELLRRRFPEESAELVTLFRELQQSELREIRRRAFNEAESALFELWVAKKPLTLRNAGALSHSTWYPSAARSRIFVALRSVFNPQYQDDLLDHSYGPNLAYLIRGAKLRMARVVAEHLGSERKTE